MLLIIDKIGKALDIFARRMTQLCVATMAIVVTLQVIWRYFLGNPLVWAEELARYALVWMTFIGAAVALRAGQLAAMDLVVTRFPPKVQKWISVLVSIANCALLAFLLYCSLNLVNMPSVLSQKSPAMRLPMAYVYMAMPLGLGLLLLQSVFRLVTDLCRKGE
ncbi:MAG: TRAP transporter small permease [Sporomusaceae bacterium]|nr:TRAP transporter small permease [Sporomusaceae bacterium]